MSWIVKAAAFVTSRQWTSWEKLCADPGKTQSELLRGIIRRNRSTRFGKDHRFDTIQSLDHYGNQVAIGDYERLRPYVERAENGEANVLTEEPVLMFTMTSGSTGAPKLIPVTATTRANHRRLTRLWYFRSSIDHPALHRGKLLGVISPAHEGKTKGNIPFGAASGLIYQSSPLWIQNAFAVPYEVAEVKDFAAKYYVIMRLAVEQEISFFGTPNPSTILRLVETADQYKEEIIRDIRDGVSTRVGVSLRPFAKRSNPASRKTLRAPPSSKDSSTITALCGPKTTGPICSSSAAGKAAPSACA